MVAPVYLIRGRTSSKNCNSIYFHSVEKRNPVIRNCSIYPLNCTGLEYLDTGVHRFSHIIIPP